MRARTCDLCPEPAVWRWNAGSAGTFYLCDDHAATKDLDDLDDLTGVEP